MHFFLYYVLPFVLVLGVLIFFHELGHFLVAKYCGVKVLKFSLGFGPKLLGKTVGETEYLISAVPLGGYVKMLGESLEDEDEAIDPEDEARSFENQHVLKRIAIVAAGPCFNLLLALLIFCSFFLVAGDQVLTPEIGQVTKDSPADGAGLMKGDIIVRIGDEPIQSWPNIKTAVIKHPGREVPITVKRGEESITVMVVPEESTVKNLFGEDIKTALIGVVASGNYMAVKLGPAEAVVHGFRKTWNIIELTCLTVVKLFQRVIPIKTIGGPILIGQLTGQLAQEDLTYLIPFMAVISINLAVLNLLPVPILDGGLIFFLLLELVLRKPVSIRKREIAQKFGLCLLLTLMAVVIYNDVTRLFE